jgi:ABC-type lipoprotein release transport system permease subunit
VLRALGCRGSQIYATLCWQALTVVVIGLLVGVPLGVIAGSTLWRRFASGLGILPAPTLPLMGIAIVIGAALVVSICAALPSGHRAAAERPAAGLRDS